MIDSPRGVSEDTQAILLLCGHFGRAAGNIKPLTANEYSALAEALHAHRLRPSDLVGRDAALLGSLAEAASGPRLRLDADRLDGLLRRGVHAAFALEQWAASGVWLCGRGDESYPKRYRKRLGKQTSPLLYVIGNGDLLNADDAVAIVGSREITDDERRAAANFGRQAVERRAVVVSGAARGTDEEAMTAALDAGGCVIGVIAENLLRAAVFPPYRRGIEGGRVVLASPFGVDLKFSVGNAMARNKFIHALADHSIVVASAHEKGGTWAGAVEALDRGWNVAVRFSAPLSAGNAALAAKGAQLIDDSGSLITISAPATTRSPYDLWPSVRDALVHFLAVPRTVDEVAEILDVLPSQAERWLENLTREGAAHMRMGKYALASSREAAAQLRFVTD
jgi:predicted Rossmann fold nucleotide-binding protein DprA/Smf involved in DNA uptake